MPRIYSSVKFVPVKVTWKAGNKRVMYPGFTFDPALPGDTDTSITVVYCEDLDQGLRSKEMTNLPPRMHHEICELTRLYRGHGKGMVHSASHVASVKELSILRCMHQRLMSQNQSLSSDVVKEADTIIYQFQDLSESADEFKTHAVQARLSFTQLTTASDNMRTFLVSSKKHLGQVGEEVMDAFSDVKQDSQVAFDCLQRIEFYLNTIKSLSSTAINKGRLAIKSHQSILGVMTFWNLKLKAIQRTLSCLDDEKKLLNTKTEDVRKKMMTIVNMAYRPKAKKWSAMHEEFKTAGQSMMRRRGRICRDGPFIGQLTRRISKLLEMDKAAQAHNYPKMSNSRMSKSASKRPRPSPSQEATQEPDDEATKKTIRVDPVDPIPIPTSGCTITISTQPK